MRPIDLIQQLDGRTNRERLNIIIEKLRDLNVAFRLESYETGTNLIVDLGAGRRRIGIGSHFDRVQDSSGANDNGSAIAVCFDIIEKFKSLNDERIGLRLFFFDEEETGLKGSKAYVRTHGVEDLAGVINMELVGLGDKLAVWPVTPVAEGALLRTFESEAHRMGVSVLRFDQIVTNTADHVSFRNAGLLDTFTVTCISDLDVEVAKQYFKALASGSDRQLLFEILSKAPIFQHYHQPTDTYDRLSEDALTMTSAVIWDTVLAFTDRL
jgi:Zn-dependent M28 family amino/carboxypeptidase